MAHSSPPRSPRRLDCSSDPTPLLSPSLNSSPTSTTCKLPLTSDQDEAPVKSLPYYHSLHIPLIIGNTGETHTLKICIHPNWRIKGTSSTIHLRHLEATLDNETEHDGKVLALGYDVADLWGTWVGYQEGRHEYKTIRQIQSQRFNLWSLIFIILAVVSGLLTTGHPVWMVTSCYTSSLSIPLAQPISFIYREWTETLLPILSPIQLHDQNSRARPAHLFSRLDQELFQIQLGLATWNASKLPGPGPELFTLLEKSQNCIPDSSAFNALWRSAANALKGGIAEIIADRIQESDSTLESIQHISLYWNITGGENSQVIRSLRVLYDGMVNLDAIETFLIQSKKDFERQSSHPEYTGLSTSLSIQDMLDAITHTLTHINPYTSLIPPLLSRALEKLTLVNETITAQNQIWNTLLLGRGVVERHVLEFDNRWLLRRTTVSETWDDESLGEDELEVIRDVVREVTDRVTEAFDLRGRPSVFERGRRPSHDVRKWWFWML